MRHQTLLRIFILLFLAFIVYLIITQIGPGEETGTLQELDPDGVEMRYTAFDRENRKTLEITSTESRNVERDKTLMKNIRATIFKEGKLDQDLKISSDRGYITDFNNNFFLEDNARLTSDDLNLVSKSFLIKGRNLVTTEEVVEYTVKNLQGTADRGMEYFIKLNVARFVAARGTHHEEGREFEFNTSVLWVMDRQKSVVMEEDTEFRNARSLLRSNRLEIKFDEDFKQVKRAISLRDSYLYMEIPEENEIREIKSNYLENRYNTEGLLMRTIARKDVAVFIKNPKQTSEIFSPIILVDYESGTGQIDELRMDQTGKVVNRGEKNFSVSADQTHLKFEKGEIISGRSIGNCRFRFGEYRGTTPKISYDLRKNKIRLQGPDSRIRHGENTYISSEYTVDTETNVLTSPKEIKSILKPEQNSVLFSQDDLFIHAKQIRIFTRENRIRYTDSIRLYQGDTVLRAGILEFAEGSRIRTEGKVFLSFKDKAESIVLQGERILFDPDKRQIVVEDKALLQSGDQFLRAKKITIEFNDEEELEQIFAEKSVTFSKEAITGTSKSVVWRFKEGLMTFRNEAQIKTQSGGITKGQELLLDLKKEKITILSDRSGRSQTIIE